MHITCKKVVAILTESMNPNNYWKILKNRLKKEGNESVTNCNQLKLQSSAGEKMVSKLNAKKLQSKNFKSKIVPEFNSGLKS